MSTAALPDPGLMEGGPCDRTCQNFTQYAAAGATPNGGRSKEARK